MIEQAIAAIQAELPGWVPAEGQLDMILLEQMAAMAAQAANVASTASQAIFEYYGQLVGIIPLDGSPATALTSWTMVDDAGYTVPVGTVVGYQLSGNQISLFSTVETFNTIAASPGRTIPTAQLTNGSPIIFDPGNSFTQNDVGKLVTAVSGIPGSTYIESVQGYNQATLTNNATANRAGESITLGALAGTSVAPNIEIQASQVGSVNNGLATGPLTLITALSFVSNVVSTTVSSGGSNSETVTQYLNRLAQELQLLTPRPIVPTDYAILAASVDGVDRATAYNNTFAGVNNVPANLSSGSNVVTLAPATTVASGSNGANLPQAIIDVASTSDYPSAGTFLIESSIGYTEVTYTNKTSNSFTGCTGGAGQLTTGNVVSGSSFLFSPFDVSLGITGTGIPSSTTIATYVSPVQVQMSANASSDEDNSPISISSNTNIERAVAVSALDENGQPVSNTISNEIVALLSSEREINFMVSYLQPSYVDIYVNYIVIAEPTATASTLNAAIQSAVTDFLNPANWAGGNQTPPVWDTTITDVYYLSVAGIIEAVSGVQSIQVLGGVPSLGLDVVPNPAYGYNDISLVQSIGVALPNLMSVSGTVLLGS